jgi:hypothetical protein
MTMERFVIHENIKRYLELLQRTTEQSQRAQIRRLLAEECQKEKNRESVRRASTPRG